MCVPLLALILVAQIGPGSSPIEMFEKVVQDGADRQAEESATARQQAFDEQQFVNRFNDLTKAMRDFSVKYRNGRVIDVKAVESIKQAYRKLEQADSWFRIRKSEKIK